MLLDNRTVMVPGIGIGLPLATPLDGNVGLLLNLGGRLGNQSPRCTIQPDVQEHIPTQR